MTNETLRERMTALETWVEGHEKLCAERYGSLRGDLKWILRGVIGLLLAVCAWLAIQLWDGAQRAIAFGAQLLVAFDPGLQRGHPFPDGFTGHLGLPEATARSPSASTDPRPCGSHW